MKKILSFAFCAVAALSAARAADGVTSENVVGYKSDIPMTGNDYSYLAAPFVNIGTAETKIKDMFSNNSVFIESDSSATADNIFIWEDGGYTRTYFYSSDAAGWSDVNDGFAITEDTVVSGQGFWVIRRDAADLLKTAGEVVTDAVPFTAKASDYTMVGNPFSEALPIKGITGALVESDSSATADNVFIWENGSYTRTYFYSSDATGWSDVNDGFAITEDTVAAGQGFWFISRSATDKDVTLPCPYTL